MNRIATSATALTALVFTAMCLAADDPADAPLGDRLIGTWKLVSAKYGGQDFEFPEGTTMLKHVTPAQFMWATYDEDGTVSRAAGGTYTLKGDRYTEAPEYGSGEDFKVVKGGAHAFQCEIDGNTWRHNGELSNGLTIEEVWERVEKVEEK